MEFKSFPHIQYPYVNSWILRQESLHRIQNIFWKYILQGSRCGKQQGAWKTGLKSCATKLEVKKVWDSPSSSASNTDRSQLPNLEAHSPRFAFSCSFTNISYIHIVWIKNKEWINLTTSIHSHVYKCHRLVSIRCSHQGFVHWSFLSQVFMQAIPRNYLWPVCLQAYLVVIDEDTI